jgi:hypothetical protein
MKNEHFIFTFSVVVFLFFLNSCKKEDVTQSQSQPTELQVIKSVVSISAKFDLFEDLQKSEQFNSFITAYPGGLDELTLQLVNSEKYPNVQIIVGKVKGSNLVFAGYVTKTKTSPAYNIILKDEKITKNEAGYSGEYSILDETGSPILKASLKDSKVLNVERFSGLKNGRTQSCFGDCAEKAENTLREDVLSYVACSFNPCFVAIVIYCTGQCW